MFRELNKLIQSKSLTACLLLLNFFPKIPAYIAAVDALAAELVSSDASHTIICNYKGTDEPSVSWTVAGSIVSDSDDGITITPGTLNTGTNERYNISSVAA